MARIQRALISVSDKSGVVELARRLQAGGVQLLSTGGTHRVLRDEGLAVEEIAAFTQSPEILDGRVKTLHPKIHGGILFRRDDPSHVAMAREHGIEPIDLVVVNLYPFAETVARWGVTLEEAVENVDVGGPAMLRAAAKNHENVVVLCDPSQYDAFLTDWEANAGDPPLATRRAYAAAAFAHTARYDRAIHHYLCWAFHETAEPAPSQSDEEAEDPDFPPSFMLSYHRHQRLRYGENPHQQAAAYIDPAHVGPSVLGSTQLNGKELSYNNILDLDAAWRLALEFDKPTVVVVKHNNPCGAAAADNLVIAWERALAGDPVSAFGGVIAINTEVDEPTALSLTEPNRFVEAIIAPSFAPAAVTVLTTRPAWRKSVRLLSAGAIDNGDSRHGAAEGAFENRPVLGGLLRQSLDIGPDGFADRRFVTKAKPTAEQLRDLAFAWKVVKHVRSNAIVVAGDEAVYGVGAGQMSRVDSTRIALEKAAARASGAVLASDAFFPFRDGIDLAAKAGIRAIVQPGGSVRDQECIDACDEHGVAMIFTGRRHFRH